MTFLTIWHFIDQMIIRLMEKIICKLISHGEGHELSFFDHPVSLGAREENSNSMLLEISAVT